MPPDTHLDGVGHATGTIEHLFVASGHLTAGPTGTPTDLRAGDLLAFARDVPHRHRGR